MLALAALVLVALAGASACRDKPKASDPPDGGAAGAGLASSTAAAEEDALPVDADANDDALTIDGGHRFRDAGPKVEVDPDGPIDPACTGSEVAFATVIVDRRCAISSARAKRLRARLERDGGAAESGSVAPPPGVVLRQEAKLAEDGRIVLRLVNAGVAPLTLPLSFASKVPAFTVLAEDERHAIFELEAPRFDVGPPGGPDASAADERPHFARIVLAPGAAAVATISIRTGVLRTLARGPGGEKCEGGPCTPARLAKGRYVLHVGELLTDIEAGAPARVTFVLP